MKRLYNIVMCGLGFLLLTACQGEGTGEEVPDGGTPVPVTLGVRCHSASTRATGIPESPEYDIEKIHSWWVVLVNQKGIVTNIISRPAGMTSYVEQEQIETKIPKGGTPSTPLPISRRQN